MIPILFASPMARGKVNHYYKKKDLALTLRGIPIMVPIPIHSRLTLVWVRFRWLMVWGHQMANGPRGGLRSDGSLSQGMGDSGPVVHGLGVCQMSQSELLTPLPIDFWLPWTVDCPGLLTLLDCWAVPPLPLNRMTDTCGRNLPSFSIVKNIKWNFIKVGGPYNGRKLGKNFVSEW